MHFLRTCSLGRKIFPKWDHFPIYSQQQNTSFGQPGKNKISFPSLAFNKQNVGDLNQNNRFSDFYNWSFSAYIYVKYKFRSQKPSLCFEFSFSWNFSLLVFIRWCVGGLLKSMSGRLSQLTLPTPDPRHNWHQGIILENQVFLVFHVEFIFTYKSLEFSLSYIKLNDQPNEDGR